MQSQIFCVYLRYNQLNRLQYVSNTYFQLDSIVLLVLLAERNNGYSSSLNYKQREERLKEEGRRLDRKRAALKAKHKEEHRIWMELMGFAKEEEKKEIDKDKL